MDSRSSENVKNEVSDVRRFSVGLSMLIWSLACAIGVGNLLPVMSPSNYESYALFSVAGLFLIILPPIAAYLLIVSTIGILKQIREEHK